MLGHLFDGRTGFFHPGRLFAGRLRQRLGGGADLFRGAGQRCAPAFTSVTTCELECDQITHCFQIGCLRNTHLGNKNVHGLIFLASLEEFQHLVLILHRQPAGFGQFVKQLAPLGVGDQFVKFVKNFACLFARVHQSSKFLLRLLWCFDQKCIANSACGDIDLVHRIVGHHGFREPVRHNRFNALIERCETSITDHSQNNHQSQHHPKTQAQPDT
jgi:hypothetical protein